MTDSLRHPLSRAKLVLTCAVLFTHLPATVARAADAGAEPGLISISGEVDGVSRYVWRTLAYSEGAVVQPSVTLTFDAAELNVWANVDPSLVGSGRLTELDFSVAWNLDLGLVEVIPSFMLYTYPQFGEANTGEVQLELRREIPGSLSAFVRHSTDVLDYPGASFTFVGLDREWSLEDGGSVSLTAQAGRGSRRFSETYLPGAQALNLVGLGASWTVSMGQGWAVRPHAEWLEVVDAEARALMPAHTPVTFGIALGRL